MLIRGCGYILPSNSFKRNGIAQLAGNYSFKKHLFYVELNVQEYEFIVHAFGLNCNVILKSNLFWVREYYVTNFQEITCSTVVVLYF